MSRYYIPHIRHYYENNYATIKVNVTHNLKHGFPCTYKVTSGLYYGFRMFFLINQERRTPPKHWIWGSNIDNTFPVQ